MKDPRNERLPRHHLALSSWSRCCSRTTAASGASQPRPGIDWPQFRGIRAAGVDERHPAPVTWDVAKKQAVRWKTPIPGLGHSSPVVWGDAVYVATSISGQKDAGIKVGYYGDIDPVKDDTPHEWRVYALDKKTGAIRWQKTVLTSVPKIKRHMKSTHANSTLATDGERIIAFFGSEGLHAFDMKGKQLWKKDLGVLDAGYYMAPDAQWETGSSPILHDGVVVVQADVQKGSFIAAFDAKDGKELWRKTREDVPTWSTPTVHEVNGRTQLLVNGMRHVGAYDFKTGDVIWKLSGGGDIPVPTPVVGDGLVFVTNAHGLMAPVYAIKDTATGDISLKDGADKNDGVVWSLRPRRRLHGDAAGLPRRPLRGDLQRRADGVRHQDREEALHAADRRRDGVHGLTGRGRRQGLFRERGRPGVRPQSGSGLSGDRHQRDGREHARHAGLFRGNDVLENAGACGRRWRLTATSTPNFQLPTPKRVVRTFFGSWKLTASSLRLHVTDDVFVDRLACALRVDRPARGDAVAS